MRKKEWQHSVTYVTSKNIIWIKRQTHWNMWFKHIHSNPLSFPIFVEKSLLHMEHRLIYKYKNSWRKQKLLTTHHYYFYALNGSATLRYICNIWKKNILQNKSTAFLSLLKNQCYKCNSIPYATNNKVGESIAPLTLVLFIACSWSAKWSVTYTTYKMNMRTKVRLTI